MQQARRALSFFSCDRPEGDKSPQLQNYTLINYVLLCVSGKRDFVTALIYLQDSRIDAKFMGQEFLSLPPLVTLSQKRALLSGREERPLGRNNAQFLGRVKLLLDRNHAADLFCQIHIYIFSDEGMLLDRGWAT